MSDRDLAESDTDEPTPADPTSTTNTNTLESIQEGSLPSSPAITGSLIDLKEEDEWSVLSADGDESDIGTGQELADSFASLDLAHDHSPMPEAPPASGDQDTDADKTLTQDAVNSVLETLAESNESRPLRLSHHEQPIGLSNRRWIRSASSPSRSPARNRRLPNKRKRRAAGLRTGNMGNYTTFYDYLFL